MEFYDNEPEVRAAIARSNHRELIGGLWDEVGTLQLEFLKAQGLRPDMSLLDLGCGSGRFAVKAVPYLTNGRYGGVDISQALLEAAKAELSSIGVSSERYDLHRTPDFLPSSGMSSQFDFGIAQSVFTHLPLSELERALRAIASRFLSGRFFATFFVAPPDSKSFTHSPGGIVSFPDRDPFHFTVEQIGAAAARAGWGMRWIGAWNHPRNQQIAEFIAPSRFQRVGAADRMQHRRLGSTGLVSSIVGVGTWQWSGEWGRDYEAREVGAMLGAAREAGVNLIDTAECYGDHSVERLIGSAIAGKRDDWIVCTKFGHHYRGHLDRRAAFDRVSVEQQLHASLRALSTDYIDIYLFHSGANADLENPALWEFLRDQQAAGKIKHLGVSLSGENPGLWAEQTRRAKALGAEVVQTVFSAVRPQARDVVLPLCEREGLGVIARGVLAQGFLSGKIDANTHFAASDLRAAWGSTQVNARLADAEAARARLGAGVHDPVDWAISWPLSDLRVACAIVGAQTIEQIRANATAGHSHLIDSDHPLAAAAPARARTRPAENTRLKLSVVVVGYNMARELPRTIRSLSPSMQCGVTAEDYEIILVDNGSTAPFDETHLKSLAPNLRVLRVDNPSPSPAGAINLGLGAARGDLIGVWIDGARMASPGLLCSALAAARTSDRTAIGTIAFHLGAETQNVSVHHGYNQNAEDMLLDQSGWEQDGYRLFDIAVLAASSQRGWFETPAETNALFLRAEHWREIGGYDERFQTPGGGLVNLDTWKRICENPTFDVVMLLGEATFHQFHGGVATNAHTSPHHFFEAEYLRIRGHHYSAPTRTPRLYGQVGAHARRSIELSAGTAPHQEVTARSNQMHAVDHGHPIPVLFCIDAEPDEFDPKPNDPSDWALVETCIDKLEAYRPRLAEATGRMAAFTWAVRADPQVAHIYGEAGWGFRYYREAWRNLIARGDEIALHPHGQRWLAAERRWVSGNDDPAWAIHVLGEGYSAYVKAMGRLPQTLRYGNRFMSQPLASTARALGFKFDLTLEPGYRGRSGNEPAHAVAGRCPNYFEVPRTPYESDRENYRSPASGGVAGMRYIPLSTANLDNSAPQTSRPYLRAAAPDRHLYDVLHLCMAPASFAPAVDHILRESERPYLSVVIRCDMITMPEVWANLETLRTHPLARRFEFAGPERTFDLASVTDKSYR